MDIKTSNNENYITLLEKDQYKILGGIGKDMVMGWYSALVTVEEPDGTMYEPVAITKDKLIKKGIATLSFLYRYGVVLNEDNLKTVKNKLLKLFEGSYKIIEETNDKVQRNEVYRRLSEFIMNNTEEITDIKGKMITVPNIFIKEKFGYIHTPKIQTFISENKDMGWERLEILKMLKRCNLLNASSKRKYDKKVKVNGKCKNYYVIKLHDEKGNLIIEDEAEETIEIKPNGESKDD